MGIYDIWYGLQGPSRLASSRLLREADAKKLLLEKTTVPLIACCRQEQHNLVPRLAHPALVLEQMSVVDGYTQQALPGGQQRPIVIRTS